MCYEVRTWSLNLNLLSSASPLVGHKMAKIICKLKTDIISTFLALVTFTLLKSSGIYKLHAQCSVIHLLFR